jgi:hypothetical protein
MLPTTETNYKKIAAKKYCSLDKKLLMTYDKQTEREHEEQEFQ